MSVRAKLQLIAITDVFGGGKILKFGTRYDQSIPEDQRFQKASPWGEFEMRVDNPAAIEKFENGKHYYVDFIAVD